MCVHFKELLWNVSGLICKMLITFRVYLNLMFLRNTFNFKMKNQILIGYQNDLPHVGTYIE